MPKKQNTRRKDGLIAVQVYLGMDENKKRKYKTVYGKTQKEANAKAEQIKLSLRKGIDVSAGKDTFKEWGDRLLNIKANEVSTAWKNSINSCYKKLEPIYDTPIAKIKLIDLQNLLYELSTKKLSRKTLLEIKNLIFQIFKLAVDNRIIEYNPASSLKLPAAKESNKRTAISEEQRMWIEETPHRAQTAAMIMLYSGLRRGELIPLMWSDIDFNKNTINVNKSVEMINGKSEVKNTTKTKSGIRCVNIPKKLVDYLKEIPKNNLLVCPSAKGTLMSDSAWKRMWESYMIDLNLKYGKFNDFIGNSPVSKFNPNGVPMVIETFTAHNLRHTFATMLYFAGVDILTAKEQLGHSDIKTTLSIYTHLDNQFKEKSMNKLDEYLSSNKIKDICG